MCWMCEENNGEYEHCQDCGASICFDAKEGDEYPQLAGVTSSGDLFCLWHAKRYEAEAERQAEEEQDYFPGPWDW